MRPRELQGPPRYLSEHPAALALALSGAGTAAGVFATRAARTSGAKRFGWALLTLLQFAIFIGILSLRRPRTGHEQPV